MTGQEWERVVHGWLRQLGGWECRFEPKVQNGHRMDGGTPDFGVFADGLFHLIECKLSARGRMPLAKGDGSGDGVSPAQRAEMERATALGVRCWIAARLELTESQRRKLAQQPIFGGGEASAAIQRLIPWPEWERRIRVAERMRMRGGEPEASILAADFVNCGWSLLSATELRKALELDDQSAWSQLHF